MKKVKSVLVATVLSVFWLGRSTVPIFVMVATMSVVSQATPQADPIRISAPEFEFFKYAFSAPSIPYKGRMMSAAERYAKLLGLDERETSIFVRVSGEFQVSLEEARSSVINGTLVGLSNEQLRVVGEGLVTTYAAKTIRELGGVGASKLQKYLAAKPVSKR